MTFLCHFGSLVVGVPYRAAERWTATADRSPRGGTQMFAWRAGEGRAALLPLSAGPGCGPKRERGNDAPTGAGGTGDEVGRLRRRRTVRVPPSRGVLARRRGAQGGGGAGACAYTTTRGRASGAPSAASRH
ncbi:hypothetical protein GCM10023347_20130 [Streptomyces chumphonensis]